MVVKEVDETTFLLNTTKRGGDLLCYFFQNISFYDELLFLGVDKWIRRIYNEGTGRADGREPNIFEF